MPPSAAAIAVLHEPQLVAAEFVNAAEKRFALVIGEVDFFLGGVQTERKTLRDAHGALRRLIGAGERRVRIAHVRGGELVGEGRLVGVRSAVDGGGDSFDAGCLHDAAKKHRPKRC